MRSEWLSGEDAHAFKPLFDSPPELAELQATIARLETQVAKAINLDFERRAEIERLKTAWFEMKAERDALYTSQPAPVSVLPERKPVSLGVLSESNTHNQGWNACLDKVKELNQ